jgi:DNA-binding transcriptional ArsR family regulator
MDIGQVFEALASTPRRKILAYLSSSSMTAGEIAERFDMSKPALSKHLKILENAKLVQSERKGQFIHYSLADPNMMLTLTNYLGTFCPVASPLQKESADKARRLQEEAAQKPPAS